MILMFAFVVPGRMKRQFSRIVGEHLPRNRSQADWKKNFNSQSFGQPMAFYRP